MSQDSISQQQLVPNLVCPITKQPLYYANTERTLLATADGQYSYEVDNGIIKLKHEQLHYKIIIPARLQSTRLPNKPLQLISNWELINTVVFTALQTGGEVIVATDSEEIKQAVEQFVQVQQLPLQVQVVMTATTHQNGTERLAEVVDILQLADDEIIVNIQGDEPFFNPDIIADLVDSFIQQEARNPQLKMATIGQTATAEEVHNPNAVKVVTDQHQRALYFSRSAIPHPHASVTQTISYIKHAGVYCYRAGFVKQYKALPMTRLASIESLEQLKVLENGYDIYLMMIQGRGFIGVDTPEDLAQAQAIKSSYYEQFAPTDFARDQVELTSYQQFLAQFGAKVQLKD